MPQGDRPAGAADPPPHGRPGAGAHPAVRAGVLRGVAPASSLGAPVVRGRGPDRGPSSSRPGGPGEALGVGPAEEEDAYDGRWAAGAEFSDADGSSGDTVLEPMCDDRRPEPD